MIADQTGSAGWVRSIVREVCLVLLVNYFNRFWPLLSDLKVHTAFGTVKSQHLATLGHHLIVFVLHVFGDDGHIIVVWCLV